MQITQINQNLNNNETAFKRLVIKHPEQIEDKLFYEIAQNKDLRALTKYFHKKNTNVFVYPGSKFKRIGGYVPTLSVGLEGKGIGPSKYLYETEIVQNVKDVLKDLNAKNIIKEYEEKQIYIANATGRLKDVAEKMIEDFNNSLV